MMRAATASVSVVKGSYDSESCHVLRWLSEFSGVTTDVSSVAFYVSSSDVTNICTYIMFRQASRVLGIRVFRVGGGR